jgi:hypothetical protein
MGWDNSVKQMIMDWMTGVDFLQEAGILVLAATSWPVVMAIQPQTNTYEGEPLVIQQPKHEVDHPSHLPTLEW